MDAKYTPEQLEAIRNAAPELLEALQTMIRTFEGLASIHNDAYRQARAAIAKATNG